MMMMIIIMLCTFVEVGIQQTVAGAFLCFVVEFCESGKIFNKDKRFRCVHMNLSPSVVRPSPVAFGLVTQKYCDSLFCVSVTGLFVYVRISERCRL